MMRRFFAWLLKGLVCFHPTEKQIYRRRDWWPGLECLVCGRWQGFSTALAFPTPQLKRTVRPDGANLARMELRAWRRRDDEVEELEEMTRDTMSGQAGGSSLLPRNWRTQ